MVARKEFGRRLEALQREMLDVTDGLPPEVAHKVRMLMLKLASLYLEMLPSELEPGDPAYR